jgi:hypothetical protein
MDMKVKSRTPIASGGRSAWTLAAMFVLTAGCSAEPGLNEPALPDWSGAWQLMGNTVFDQGTLEGEGGATDMGVRQRPPYNAEWEALYQANLERRDQNLLPDPQSECGIPVGWPRMVNIPGLYEFAVTRDQTWIISESGPYVIRIHTDGRSHPAPEDMWPTYTGHSIGEWEGDTLVFETIGLKGSSGMEGILDRTGVLISDAARVTTRVRQADEETLEVQMTIEDPQSLTAPWVVTKQFRRAGPFTRLFDYACGENNRNPIDYATGKTLTLGPDGRPIDSGYQN